MASSHLLRRQSSRDVLKTSMNRQFSRDVEERLVKNQMSTGSTDAEVHQREFVVKRVDSTEGKIATSTTTTRGRHKSAGGGPGGGGERAKRGRERRIQSERDTDKASTSPQEEEREEGSGGQKSLDQVKGLLADITDAEEDEEDDPPGIILTVPSPQATLTQPPTGDEDEEVAGFLHPPGGKKDSSATGTERPSSRASSQFSQPPDEGSGEVREAWDSKITFMLATIGYAVGLGNVWRNARRIYIAAIIEALCIGSCSQRFPYLAQKNGGGAFLIPYWIMLFAEGLPLFLLEMAVGQRLRKGSLGAWNRVSPYLGGIGIASAIVSFNVALYYNTVIAWCLAYFFKSFQFPLPWAECPNVLHANMTYSKVEECAASSPTQYFWYRETLNISPDIGSPETFNWTIAATLVLAWCLVYLCIIKGVTENPSVIYVTAIYPYLVLIIFFVRAVTLEGMADGVMHLFKPKWEKLMDPVVWLEAGTQIFFSLGLAFGGLIAYSSYNPVNNNCTRDALVVAFTNCATSMFAGIVIFAIMGFKAHKVHSKCIEDRSQTLTELFGDVPPQVWADILAADGERTPTDSPQTVSITDPGGNNMTLPKCNLEDELDNSASGTGLAFILFTEAVNQFPAGNLWAVLFFMMLFTLGLDSQFGTMQGVVQCLIDLKMFTNVKKEIITGVLCTVCTLISLCFAQGAGNYIFTLFDNFSGTIPLLVIALCECLSISYVYGLRKFSRDIELMTGSRPNYYWLFCWKFISPLAMTAILVASLAQMALSGSTYEAWVASEGTTTAREWPGWCKALAGGLIGMSVLWIPAVAGLKALGVSVIPYEGPGWFPEADLKAHYGLGEVTKDRPLEKNLLGFREDGREGLIIPTFPRIETALSEFKANDDLELGTTHQDSVFEDDKA